MCIADELLTRKQFLASLASHPSETEKRRLIDFSKLYPSEYEKYLILINKKNMSEVNVPKKSHRTGRVEQSAYHSVAVYPQPRPSSSPSPFPQLLGFFRTNVARM